MRRSFESLSAYKPMQSTPNSQPTAKATVNARETGTDFPVKQLDADSARIAGCEYDHLQKISGRSVHA